ncbi:putative membrane protein [Riemerella columbipharyngis]|uniref:Putative membrane protein n=1 Tax=Riemerella columbipharyngis TaxID=1071918 RepID=A0A1G7ER76_9FLAO|nr:putative membrane protein [Riemerella columbipharyngis]
MLTLWIFVFGFSFILSGINPKDYFTWVLEVFPALIVFFILTLNYKNFKFSNFTYVFILLHFLILLVVTCRRTLHTR